MQNLEPTKYSQVLMSLTRRILTNWKMPVAVICGNPETGKTDTALLLAEIGLNTGLLECFASNIQTYNVGKRITNLDEMSQWFREAAGKKLFILDEAGIHDDTRSPMSIMNRTLRHEVFLIRKFKGHIIFVLQEMKDLDNWKNSELTGTIIKKKVHQGFEALVKFRGITDLFRFTEMPKTSIEFNTLDVAPFALERQLEELADFKRLDGAAKIAYLYAKYGNTSVIARQLKKESGKNWRPQQVKRAIQAFLRDQFNVKMRGPTPAIEPT